MSTQYEKALDLIDNAHAQDPQTIIPPNSNTLTPIPSELHYANQMTKYLALRCPSAPDTLRLAIRAQHLKRWEVPRSSYPMTTRGYHAWRRHLQLRQGELAEEMCLAAGFSTAAAARVAALVRKEGLARDAETQVLEDVACLVFLEDGLEGFAGGYEEEKVLGILKKTWGKMSAEGRELAMGMEMSDRVRGLIGKALGGSSTG